jgi:ankyrin repeat protein
MNCKETKIQLLLKSAKEGNEDIFKTIPKQLKSYLNTAYDKDYLNTFLLSIKYGHLNLMIKLIDLGVRIDIRDYNPNRNANGLHYACWYGKIDIAVYLLKTYPKIFTLDDIDNFGNTPILYSIYGGMENIMNWILNQGKSINVSNNKGHNVLIQSCCSNNLNLVKILTTKYKFDINYQDNDSHRPIHYASMNGNIEIMEYLLSIGAKLNYEDDKYSVLLSAAFGGKINVYEWYKKKGYSLNEKNKKGDTPLLITSSTGNLDLIKWLLKNGSSVHEKNNNNVTSIIGACNSGHFEVVKWLLENTDANIHDFDKESEHTSFLISIYRNDLLLMKYLIDKGANIYDMSINEDNALLIAIYKGYNNIIDYLLSKGLTLNVKNKYKMGSLITAVNGGHIKTVKKIVNLMKEYPDCNCHIDDREYCGYTAFLFAVKLNHFDIVKYLASEGCNINITTNYRMDSIQVIKEENVEMFKYLQEIKSLNSLQIITKNCFIENIDIIDELQINILDKVHKGIDKSILDSALQIYKECKKTHKKYNLYLYDILSKGHMNWSPKRSYLFSKKYNNIVNLLLENIQPNIKQLSIIKKSRLPLIPSEIWIHIISFINRNDWD